LAAALGVRDEERDQDIEVAAVDRKFIALSQLANFVSSGEL
jgi:hypothetical protein